MQNLRLILVSCMVLTTLAACTVEQPHHSKELATIYEQKLDEKLKTLPPNKDMTAANDPSRAQLLHQLIQHAFHYNDWKAAEDPARKLTALRDHWLGADVSSDAAESVCDLAISLRHQGRIQESLQLVQQRIQKMNKEMRWRVAPGMVLLLRQEAANYNELGDTAKASNAMNQAAEWQKTLPPRLAAEYAAHEQKLPPAPRLIHPPTAPLP